MAGSSAGAHLAAMAALTINDPNYQPGFEHDDTTVTGAVCLYGYYGDLDTSAGCFHPRRRPTSGPMRRRS